MRCKLRQPMRGFITILLLATIFAAGSIYAMRSSTNAAASASTQSDLEWARKQGFLAEDVRGEDRIKQAVFLKMVMTVYAAKEPGLFVPKGAENHWAAEYYATAKKEGIIDCGCQIKPNLTLTIEEAARFVVNAVNLKAGNADLKITEVYTWVPNSKDVKSSLTNNQAASIIRKMSAVFEEKGFSTK